MSTPPGEAPAEIQLADVTYVLSREWRAVPVRPGASAPHEARWVLEDPALAIVPAGSVGAGVLRSLPVYAQAPGGVLAVASGRVFVRLAEGASVRSLQSSFGAVGCQIEDVPRWAPHTAWLVASSGEVTAALAAMPSLRAIPGVVHVEPQLLRPRALK
jgi:hypothetical protein